jgi:hypothetical protein
MLHFNEIIYRVSLVTWIKKKRIIDLIMFELTKKQIIKTIEFFAKKQVNESTKLNFSIIIIFISTSKIILNASFFSSNVATSSIKSNSSILLIRSALKKYFEFFYHFNFFDSLRLWIMSCMKNVINFNQILKSRSYKKIMKNFNEDK